jgi:hypothetical protein
MAPPDVNQSLLAPIVANDPAYFFNAVVERRIRLSAHPFSI